jgi:hypothetical protein
MVVAQCLDVLAAIAALIAAIFWFRSARVQFPPPVSYWGGQGAPEGDPFFQALKSSASLNKSAAAYSCVSALCFGIKLLLQFVVGI